MKIQLLAFAMTLATTFTAQASVQFGKVDPKRAWFINCSLLFNGSKVTDTQIAGYNFHGDMNLDVSIGNARGTVLVSDIETAEGGGYDNISYSGRVYEGARGALAGMKEFTVLVDKRSSYGNTSDTFESRIFIKNRNGQVAQMHLPVGADGLVCQFVPAP